MTRDPDLFLYFVVGVLAVIEALHMLSHVAGR